MATTQRCPKCNHLNEPEATRCASCGASLLQACPRCGATRPWHVTRCPHCDAAMPGDALFTSLFQQAPSRRLKNRYIIQDTLSTGQVGAVYRAASLQDPNRRYVIKELAPTALFRPEERRQAEATLDRAVRRWSRVDHPGVMGVVERFSSQDKQYVVCQHVRGTSLRAIIRDPQLRIGPELARNWGAQLCHILAHLHAQDPAIHAPFIAPGHLMVDLDGRLVLVDLGMTAIYAPSRYGRHGSIKGYAAPELQNGFPTVASDVFAVGRLVYALLIGYLLEERIPRRLSLQRAVPGISDQLVKAIARAAHRDPAQRYARPADLAYALWEDERGEVVPIPTWRERAMVSARQQPVIAPPSRVPSSASMEALGFERDPRYGPAAETPTPAPVRRPEPEGEAKLSVNPHGYDLSDVDPMGTKKIVLRVRNTGDAEMTGRVLSHVDWITAPKRAFAVPARKRAQVILTVRGALMPSGRTREPQAISVDTNVGRQWVGVTAEIVSGPELRVESPLLDFGTLRDDAPRSTTLQITNAGRQVLTGRIEARVRWLRVDKGEFRCGPGRSHAAAVQVLPDRLGDGQQDVADALIVDSDGGQVQVAVRAWRARPRLDVGATHMDFGQVRSGEVAERYLYVGNKGDAPLTGTVRSLVPWLQAYPRDLTCAPGELVQVTLSADTVGLGDGPMDLPQALRVQSEGDTITLSLRMVVSAPRLAFGSREIDYGSVPAGESAVGALIVRNTGSAPLDAQIQPLVGWLSPAQREVHCEPGQEVRLPVTAHTASFAQGQTLRLPAALRVIAGAQVEEVAVNLTVLKPALVLDPETVDFGYIDPSRPETRTLLIANEGTGQLAWNLQTDAAWVEVSPMSGVNGPGTQQVVTLTAYGLGIEVGERSAEATLIVNSDAGRTKVPLQVGLAEPVLALDSRVLDLGVSQNRDPIQGTFRVFNRGLGVLRGTLRSDQTWLVLSRASFECPTGHSVEIGVSTDMDEFGDGPLDSSGYVSIESNGGSAELQVVFEIKLAPYLTATKVVRLNPSENMAAPHGRLNIRNEGMAAAHAELTVGAPQLVLSRNLCDIKPGKAVRIMVHLEGLRPDDPDRMYVDVQSGAQRLRVPVRFYEEPTSEQRSQ